MAHAYTTNRGKTKKAKMGIRKDAKQNSEAGLKQLATTQNLGSALFCDAPLDRLLSLGTKSGSATATKARLQERIALQQQQKQALVCSNPACPSLAAVSASAAAAVAEPIIVVLSDCARCKQARYCSKACQVAHWSSHKLECKSSADEAARVLAALRLQQAGAPSDSDDNTADTIAR